jgi:hypothetical protein
MTALGQFGALLRLRTVLARRWIRENGFTLFVMAPLVLGGAGVIFAPYLEAAGRALRSGAAGWASDHAGAVVGSLAVALAVARLSSAIRDAYALDGDDFYLDALPTNALARLHDVLVVRAAKALPVALGALFAIYLAAPKTASLASVALATAPALLAGAVALAVLETGAAFALVRLRTVTAPRLAAVGALAIATAIAADRVTVWLAGAAVAVGYAVAVYGFLRWRIEDRDAAREALARARRTGARFERFADRLLGPRVGAQVTRDLRLVRRGFSTVPYVAAAAALLFPALAVWAGDRFDLPPEPRAHAVECATVLAAFALAAVTHALVVYERARVWIDLTAGVARDDFPRAKLWLGRALALPAFGLGCAAAAASGVRLGPAEVVKLAWLTWSTATLASVLCYELKERPAAGVVLAFLPAVGISLLVVFYGPGDVVFYFALIGYVYAMFQLTPRAGLKVEWER